MLLYLPPVSPARDCAEFIRSFMNNTIIVTLLRTASYGKLREWQVSGLVLVAIIRSYV